MKRTFLPILLALAVPCAFAAPGAPAVKDQASTAHQDTEFLKKASQGNVDEIDLAQQALKKSNNQQIKDFAQKIIDDHTALAQKMQPFASEAGIDVPKHPDASTEAEKLKLDVMSGDSYDKSYVKEMVEDHHKDLMEFRQEVATTGYPAFKTAVEDGEKVIREHLVMANKLAKSMGLATAPVPPLEK